MSPMDNVRYYLLKGTLRAMGALPLRSQYRLGRLLSWVAEKVVHYRRDVVLVNLARSYPARKYGEIRRLAHEFYIHLGEIFAETVWMAGCHGRPRRFADSRLVRVTNPETINRLFEQTPGVMLVSGHMGNWELMGGVRLFDYGDTPPAFDERDVIAAYKRLHDPVMDKLMKEMRSAVARDRSQACQLVESADFIRAIARQHGERHIWYSINDQHPYKGAAHVDLEFMHQHTSTMTATYRIAAKYKFSLVYLSIRRTAEGHYEYTFIPIAEDASKMPVDEMINTNYRLMEEDLEAQPALYLWSHKRWK